jgi:hypothetical protein
MIVLLILIHEGEGEYYEKMKILAIRAGVELFLGCKIFIFPIGSRLSLFMSAVLQRIGEQKGSSKDRLSRTRMRPPLMADYEWHGRRESD